MTFIRSQSSNPRFSNISITLDARRIFSHLRHFHKHSFLQWYIEGPFDTGYSMIYYPLPSSIIQRPCILSGPLQSYVHREILYLFWDVQVSCTPRVTSKFVEVSSQHRILWQHTCQVWLWRYHSLGVYSNYRTNNWIYEIINILLHPSHLWA